MKDHIYCFSDRILCWRCLLMTLSHVNSPCHCYLLLPLSTIWINMNKASIYISLFTLRFRSNRIDLVRSEACFWRSCRYIDGRFLLRRLSPGPGSAGHCGPAGVSGWPGPVSALHRGRMQSVTPRSRAGATKTRLQTRLAVSAGTMAPFISIHPPSRPHKHTRPTLTEAVPELQQLTTTAERQTRATVGSGPRTFRAGATVRPDMRQTFIEGHPGPKIETRDIGITHHRPSIQTFDTLERQPPYMASSGVREAFSMIIGMHSNISIIPYDNQ